MYTRASIARYCANFLNFNESLVVGLEPISDVVIPNIRDHTDLLDLGLKLPHIWFIDEPVEVSAIQHDDAPVPEWLWNNSVTLVFPHITPKELNVIQRRLMGWLVFNLYQEFKSFMSSKHVEICIIHSTYYVFK